MSHAQNIQRTLEAMFGQKTGKSGRFRKSQGMQFERPGAKFIFLLTVMLLVTSVFLLIQGPWIAGVLLLPIVPLLAAYVIDLRGFEVDFKNEQIRKYKSFLGLISGDWMPLSSFDSVRVYQNELKTQRGKFTARGQKKYDSHLYYYVRLVSPGLNTSISLLELDNYGRAKSQAEKVAYSARLRYIDKPAKLKAEKI